MGYGGKLAEQERARALRADAWTMADIAAELGVAKSSVSRWVRDVDFEPQPRRRARKRGPNKLERRKAAEIEELRVAGLAQVGTLSEREFLMAGLGLYAGDGAKTGNEVKFCNSNPDLVRFYCAWFRQFFEVDERRLRLRIYLHDDLDLGEAEQFWSDLARVPLGQFHRAHRVPVGSTSRTNRHVNGCCHVVYASSREMRRIQGMLSALTLVSSFSLSPG